jgi:hypothetical protein
MDTRPTDHTWANLVILGATDDGARAVVDAINKLTRAGPTNRACVIVACTQILAQNITQAGPDIAAQVREGIMTLIDDYAARLAMEESR